MSLSQEELEQKCREWQEILSLRDWEVQLHLVRYLDGDRSGTCSYQFTKKRAVIKIVEPDGYPPDASFPQDQELDLVHELLHLYFAPFGIEADTPQETAEEQSVHALSKALVKLKRVG